MSVEPLSGMLDGIIKAEISVGLTDEMRDLLKLVYNRTGVRPSIYGRQKIYEGLVRDGFLRREPAE
jgi:hypothetical protein